MSGDKVHDPKGFGQALKKLVEGDESAYVHLATAKRHMDETPMHTLTFGVLGELVVKGDYDDACKYLTGEMDKGFANIQATCNGLNRVARNNARAEQANLIKPDDIELPMQEPPEVRLPQFWTAGNLDNWGEGVLLAFLAGQTLKYLKESAKLSTGAIIAVGLWLTYVPDDEEINRAYSHWKSAAAELKKARNKLGDARKDFGQVWKGPAEDAFDGYLTKFGVELEELEKAADATADRIDSCRTTLGFYQHFAVLQAVTCMVSLIAINAFGMAVPATWPKCKALMEAIGVLMSFTVVKILAAIAMVLKDMGTAVVILAFGSFVTEKENDEDREDMNGVDFEEVALSKDDIDKLVRDAGGSGGS